MPGWDAYVGSLVTVFLSRMAAGVAVYALASNAVGVLQASILRRRPARS
jgi:membrane protein insertase Oxa1/YidC/SpoIIIJ